MALLYNIRNRILLPWKKVLKHSLVRTYGKEEFWPFWIGDEYKLFTSEVLSATHSTPKKAQEEAVTEGEKKKSNKVVTEEKNQGLLSLLTWRKIVDLIKLVELLSELLKSGVDQLCLRFCIRLEDNSKYKEGSKLPPLSLLNLGVWLRAICYIPLNFLHGIVRCVTSPWNWIVRPIINYWVDNWTEGKTGVIAMFLLGLGAAAIIAASVFTGGLLPLTFMASWSLSLLVPTLIGVLIASVVITERIFTAIPEAARDIREVYRGETGYDSKMVTISQKIGSSKKTFLNNTAISYIYFNTRLIQVRQTNTDVGIASTEPTQVATPAESSDNRADKDESSPHARDSFSSYFDGDDNYPSDTDERGTPPAYKRRL